MGDVSVFMQALEDLAQCKSNVKKYCRELHSYYTSTTGKVFVRDVVQEELLRQEREVANTVSNRDVYYRISKKVGTSLFVMDTYFSTITITLMAATLMLIFSPSIVGGRH